jgi:hypothetical protein
LGEDIGFNAVNHLVYLNSSLVDHTYNDGPRFIRVGEEEATCKNVIAMEGQFGIRGDENSQGIAADFKIKSVGFVGK